MPGQLTYKSLFQYVNESIDKKISSGLDNATSASSSSSVRVVTSSDPMTSDMKLAELVASIQNMLSDTIAPNIIEGLEVKATSPISNSVTINAGSGTVGGVLYTLSDSYTLNINFDSRDSIYYIVLYKNAIQLTNTFDNTKLTIAKIVVPNPGTTSLIQNTKDSSWNAYIVNFKEYKLYGYNNQFEEDTVELLRDNIGDILADNLIGNIRLSENLKILNTQGTLEIDSAAIKIYDVDEHKLAEFNRNGTFFYDTAGRELAKFGATEARVGNIVVTKNSIQSGNYTSGSLGFKISDNGDVEFSDGTFRGNLEANTGTIGGFTITSTMLYGGIIQTGLNVATGENGVRMDSTGLSVYDDILGRVVYLPSDGSAPTFSSGIIESTIFEINTNSVLRTSETVGDGSVDSWGVLINNTGFYACEANQLLRDANVKILIDGSASFKGTIVAESGTIGSVTITETSLSGGLIEGALIRSPIIETSSSYPKVRLDETGFYYQVTPAGGKYGAFKYGDGTTYGVGVLAYLFNENFPVLSIMAEQDVADIRLYNRTDDPGSGTGPHEIGDLICVDGDLKICSVAGSPGTFINVGGSTITWGNGLVLTGTTVDVDFVDDEELVFGTGNDGKVYANSDNLVLKNVTQDKDIIFYVNDGGSNTESFRVEGSSSQIKVNKNIDFNQKQGVSFVVENRTSDPGSPVAGQMWFRTDV